jgi:hypothetical protein
MHFSLPPAMLLPKVPTFTWRSHTEERTQWRPKQGTPPPHHRAIYPWKSVANFKKQNSSWEATSSSVGQETPRLLWNPKGHYRVHNSQPMDPILSKMNPIIRLVRSKVNLSLCFKWAPRHEGVLGEWRYCVTHFWPLHYMEVSYQLHAPAILPPAKEPMAPTGWVGPRAVLDAVMRKIPSPCQDSNPGCPARSLATVLSYCGPHPSGIMPKILCALLISPCVLHPPTITVTTTGAHNYSIFSTLPLRPFSYVHFLCTASHDEIATSAREDKTTTKTRW